VAGEMAQFRGGGPWDGKRAKLSVWPPPERIGDYERVSYSQLTEEQAGQYVVRGADYRYAPQIEEA